MHYRRIFYATLAQLIDMSPTGLHRAVKNKTMSVATLQRICDVLHMDMCDLICADPAPGTGIVQDTGAHYGGTVEKIQAIQRLAADLEKQLQQPGV